MKNIILIGFMASGKSSVGRRLMRDFQMDLVDLDTVIEEKAGMLIPEIFEKIGEKAFRDLESYVVKQICGQDNQVIATGGGAILREKNRHVIKNSGFVVWLKTTPDNVLKYSSRNSDRPLIKNVNSLDKIKLMMDSRESFYEECCHYSIKSYDFNLFSISQIIREQFEHFQNQNFLTT